jgi:hypothetical protein
MNATQSKTLWLCALCFTACRAAQSVQAPAQVSAGASSAQAGAAPPAAVHMDAGSPPPSTMMTMTPPPVMPRAGSPALAAADAGPIGKADAAAAASDAAPAGVVPQFADTFEQASSLDPARYEIVMPSCSGTGVVSLDSASGHSGTHSVQVKAGGGYCNHVFFRPKGLPAQLPDPLYVRVFVKLEQALGAGHVTFVALHDTHDNADLRMGGQNQILMWNRESDDATLPELSPVGVAMSSAPSAGNWHCIEWMVSGQAAGLSTWLDGQALPGLRVDGDPTPDVDRQWLQKTGWQPKLSDVRFGWESYGDQANTLWFDDLAIAQERIGCGLP